MNKKTNTIAYSKRQFTVLQIGVSILLSLTISFFAPLEIFLSQSGEFWFTTSDVILELSICFIVFSLFIFGIQILSTRINKNLGKIITILLLILGGLIYIQGNFSFVKYGIMDGSPINWGNYKKYAIANTLFWIIPICMVLIFHRKILKNFPYKLLLRFTYGLVILQISTLLVLFGCKIIKGNNIAKYYFTNEGRFEFSKNNKNLLIVCADGFDGQKFLPVLEDEPSFREYFDGFTFFQDCAGTSLFSEESGITLLTGKQFALLNTEFNKNIEDVYRKSVFYNELKRNNWDSYLYVSESKMVAPNIASTIKNVAIEKPKIKDKKHLFTLIWKMVMFKYSPHILKRFFWYTSMDFSSEKQNSFSVDNISFLDFLKTNGVKATQNEENIYQFFWIQGPHEPAIMDRYCRPLEKVTEMENPDFSKMQYEQTVGTVRIFTEVIKALKKSQIYDNTTIIFCADHGWDVRPNPLLLIKPQHANGKLIVSKSPISMIEDWSETFLSLIDNEGYEKEYNTVFNVKEVQTERERKLYKYNINTLRDRTYEGAQTYFYKNGAFLEKDPIPYKKLNWEESLSPIKAKINSPLSHSNLVGTGLSGHETTHTWTDGEKAEMIFKLAGKHKNIILSMDYGVFNGKQNVELFINDKLFKQYEAHDETKEFFIPVSFLKNDILKLSFLLPNAVSPRSLGFSNDERALGLAIKKLSFSDANAIESLNAIKSELPIGSSGFYTFESDFVWAKPHVALTISNKKILKTGLQFSLNIPSQIQNSSPELRVYINDILCKKMNTTPGKLELYFSPEEISSFDDTYEIRIEHDFSFVPKELGINDDTRELSFQVSYIGEKR